MIYTVTEESGTKKLEQLAGSASTGTPLGTWASFETDYAPNIEWLQGGTTFNPNTYPALAMYLGGNTVPERFDHSRPSDYEDFSITTTNQIAQFDGIVNLTNYGTSGRDTFIWVNDVQILVQNYSTSSSSNLSDGQTLILKKGDTYKYSGSGQHLSQSKVRWFKHPLFIKATPTSADSDYEGTLNAIREFYVRNNTYSTEERLTGGVWIDGKPIYRKVVGATTSATTNSSTYQKLNALISGYTDVQNVNYFLSATIVDNSTGGMETPPADISSGNMRIACGKIHPIGSYIILEYTKTTD